MSLNTEEKKAVVEEISQGLSGAKTLVIAEYRGIKVASLTELRSEARKADVYLHVLKNTLAKRAVEGTSFEALADQMVGPLIYAASEDPVAAAKLLHTYSKKENALAIKSGSYNGDVLSAEEIANLASIPSREELLTKFVGMMQAPLATFARTLAALAEKKSEEEPAA
ncbi:50S ribosomal protein L10 [Neisseriaceae bacterium PsAf]|nr:50S ribosomal protein L10 [Neisseriaceae bacterium PsAf]